MMRLRRWLLSPVLDAIYGGHVSLYQLRQELQRMTAELDALKAAVTNNTTVIGSAITLINGLKKKLDDAIASGDPAALTALSAELGAQDQALADAVAANTPPTA
jgi:hypothetical protein